VRLAESELPHARAKWIRLLNNRQYTFTKRARSGYRVENKPNLARRHAQCMPQHTLNCTLKIMSRSTKTAVRKHCTYVQCREAPAATNCCPHRPARSNKACITISETGGLSMSTSLPHTKHQYPEQPKLLGTPRSDKPNVNHLLTR
jgi:hypothetical protein